MGPTALATTASINGTVQAGVSAAGASAARHSAAGVRVSVVGTGAAATTDSSGRFVLANIPAGRSLSLRFEAPGLDAVLSLGGLVPGQTLDISVTLSEGRATLSDVSPRPSPTPSPEPTPSPSPSPEPHHGHEGEVEFTGTIDSINPPSVTVAGRAVQTDANTEFKRHGDRIGLADLKVGDVVEVKGSTQSDGSVLARRITVETENEGDDDNGDDGGDDN